MATICKDLPIYSQDLKIIETIMNPAALQAQIIDKLQLQLLKELEKEEPNREDVKHLNDMILTASTAFANLKNLQ